MIPFSFDGLPDVKIDLLNLEILLHTEADEEVGVSFLFFIFWVGELNVSFIVYGYISNPFRDDILQ